MKMGQRAGKADERNENAAATKWKRMTNE